MISLFCCFLITHHNIPIFHHHNQYKVYDILSLLPIHAFYVSIGYGSIEEVSMIVIFLHMSPPLHLVHFLVFVVLEFRVISGDGARQEHLLELLLRFGQRLVLQSQLSQQFVHVFVFVELFEGLCHEVDGELGHQGDLSLLDEF